MQQHGGVVQLHADLALGQSLHGDPDSYGREREHGDGVVRVDGGPRVVVGDVVVVDGPFCGCEPGDHTRDERSDGRDGSGDVQLRVDEPPGRMHVVELQFDHLHTE